MRSLSAVLMALVGSVIMVGGAYHPHGDTSFVLSFFGGAVVVIALVYWIREMHRPWN